MNAEAATQALLIRTRNEPIQPTQRWPNAESLNTWLQLNVAVHDKVATDWEVIQGILKDSTLSPEGRVKKQAVFGAQIVSKYAFVAAPLKDADAVIARLTKLLEGPILERPKGDATVIFLREREIRDSIRGLDKNKRNVMFLNALETDQLEVVRAMLDAPGGPMVSADVEARGREAYAKRTAPDAWEKLQAVEYLREHVSSLAGQVAQWLTSLGASAADVQKAVTVKEAA